MPLEQINGDVADIFVGNMISQNAIKQMQALLVEITNKQVFLNTLMNFSDSESGVPITISIQKVTVSYAPSKVDTESYKMLTQTLAMTVRRDIDNLLMRINEILNDNGKVRI